MLSIEGSELGRIVGWEAASCRILWVVEPKPEVKGICRLECSVRIETKNLVEQDGLDANVALICVLADFDVGLVPRQAEAAFEIGIGRRRVEQ